MAVLGLSFLCEVFPQLRQAGATLFSTVRGPLTAAASLVVEHRLQTRRPSSCGSRAQPLHGMWDPPRPGLEPVSPALAGGLSTTAPPGKPWLCFDFWYWAAWVVCTFWKLIPCWLLCLQIFSTILRVVFLFMVSFAAPKLLSLIRYHLFIIIFIFIILGDGLKKILLLFMSENVLPMFSSKSFIVSGLTFRSLIHFEFIFLYVARECSNFILLLVVVQFSQHH